MTTTMKKTAFLVILLTTSYLSLTLPVKAQQVIKLTAIPPRLEIAADPGEVIAQQIKVRNEGDSQLGLQIKVQDFIVADKEGTPVPVTKEISGQWAASLWMNVSPQKFLLNPGETKALDLVAVVPEDASPGGHYAVIFYSPVEGTAGKQEGSLTGATGISPNVGTLAYITVSGDIKEEARVIRMDIPKFQEYGPIKITTEIDNLSDIHIKPLGIVKIYDWFGKLKTTLKFEEKNIFPTASRVYENTWRQKWGLGKYKAQLQAGYGTQGKALIATVFFWIIPWRVITIAVLTIILVVLLALYLKKPKEIKSDKTTAKQGN